ncbi:hypothetical protein PHMEG_00012845 [Phytophthora megakarya]|uniref:PiggyBac transposable element-derived protein domain-containing protein n=1 Tax=Phytophthora megakarya TaxID=4795 RepID=A0A225W9E3_9STRA|nr:hypothetical protein PHMEG_00012845 [Phytophthora megakarya]
MWQLIAECSNFYMHEQLENRVDPYFEKKGKRDEKAKVTGLPVANTNTKSRRDDKNVKPREAGQPLTTRQCWCHFTWYFGRYLTLDRFMDISRNLHFNSNQDPRAKTDRARKIRSVVTVLQETFLKPFVPPAELLFNKAMLPSRSSYNRTRVYMKDKPYKWGIKLFMCALLSAFRKSANGFKVYCGQKQHIAETGVIDMKSGPAAVVRNLRAVFRYKVPSNVTRFVVVDRVYTSIVLGVQLMIMDIYTIGNIMTNRFAKLSYQKRKKSKNIPLGTLTFTRSKLVNNLTASVVGENLALDRVERCEKTGELKASVQRAITYRKYYKSLFWRLVDLAITNGFIVHRAFCKKKEIKALTHVQYMC